MAAREHPGVRDVRYETRGGRWVFVMASLNVTRTQLHWRDNDPISAMRTMWVFMSTRKLYPKYLREIDWRNG